MLLIVCYPAAVGLLNMGGISVLVADFVGSVTEG
jgi:hypothetical protein